ncbi:MAG: HU family DNA-binding protein, partial [Candidatus Contendobacter sp.]|nr:HU family DNA-binding protein [Candidatus Contendobacter sp.]
LSGSVALQGAATLRLTASAGLSGSVALQGAATLRLTASGVFGQTELQGAVAVRLTASGVFGQTELQGAVAVRLTASAGLSVTTELQGGVLLRLTADAALVSAVALQGAAALRLKVSAALGETLFAPSGLRLQVLNQQLIVSVYADPTGLQMTWALDDGLPIPATWELLNNQQPLILAITGFLLLDDGVTHQITIEIWREKNGFPSLRQNRVLNLKPTYYKALQPPKTAGALLIRGWTAQTQDLTRITWDWGNEPVGMVELWAYIRPTGTNNPRMNKNIYLGVASADASSWLAEGIGAKMFTKTGEAQRVYFGVARYHQGNKSTEAITNSILINPTVQGLPDPPPPTPDEIAGTAMNWTQSALVIAVAQQMGLSAALVENVLQTALDRIKFIVSKGGRVELDHFGKFEAFWMDAFDRHNAITGDATPIAAQRNARFTLSPSFRLGTKRGTVLTDV